jgi:ABC-type branched-subunit amino acid transport system substrate-binding protein
MVDSIVGAPEVSFPGVWAAAQAAALAINNAGGINGHPVSIVTCNNQFSPNGAVACARQAVSDGVVAYTGFDLLGFSVYPVLKPAGIPSTVETITPLDAQGPLQRPIDGGGLIEFYGQPLAAVKEGAKTATLVVPETPGYQLEIAYEQETAKTVGLKILKTILLPNTQTTFASTVQQLRSVNADANILLLNAGAQTLLAQTATSQGYTPTWISYLGSFDTKTFNLMAANASKLWYVSGLPPVTASSQFSGIAQYNSEMDAAGKDGIANTGTDDRFETTLQAWLQIHALAEIAKKISGPVTSATLAAAIAKATNVDLEGFSTWSPGGAPGPKNLPMITDGGSLYYGPVKSGVYTPTSTQPTKLFALIAAS